MVHKADGSRARLGVSDLDEWRAGRQPVPDGFLCHLPVDVPPHVELSAARPWYVDGGGNVSA